MQVSLEWLNEYIELAGISPEQIAHELTMSGLEVEEIEKTGSNFTNIVVGEILEIKPHPNADKIQLATIFNGTEKKEVVCGAKNIAVGQLIPYASVDSEVMDRKTGEKFTLKPAKIRGIESEGMLCSADELGLKTSDYQQEDGILILNNLKSNIKAGQDVKQILNIHEDIVFHVMPTANRGDEMSVFGIARELSAILNRSIKYPELKNKDYSEKAEFEVEIKDESTCKYYTAGILKDIKIKPSPEWMARRLASCGIRSINNIVDITNYVMLEYGQPLHAFDLDKLGENYLCVKRASSDEKIITLDEVERKLNSDSVVIATNKENVALAGIMGGNSSEVDDNTQNILLESAYFTPVSNRKSSRSVGHRTEACSRFERGVDIKAVKSALIRAIELMQELADAKICGIAEAGSDNLEDIEITLRLGQIKKILGIDIPSAKSLEILENLGFEILGKNDFSAKILVPSYRINDVSREIDLIEEIGRIYGYDKIEPTLPVNTQCAELSKENETLSEIHKLFLGQGFNEVVTSSLIGIPLLNWIGIEHKEAKAVKVTNPQSDEHTMLRQSLIPSIANIVKYNLDQGQKDIWIYEIGKSFVFNGTPDEKNSGVQETRHLSGAISGNISCGIWNNKKEIDFYTLKGSIESLFKMLNLENRIEYAPAKDICYLHPGRSAEIRLLGKNKTCLGVFGELHPNTKEKCKIAQNVFIFDLNLEEILSNMNYTTPRYKQIPSYPAMTRDIAFITPQDLSNQNISKAIKRGATNLLKEIEIFDVYQGQHVPEGSKSVAYRLTFINAEATLTDEIVDNEMNKIREALKKAESEISFRE